MTTVIAAIGLMLVGYAWRATTAAGVATIAPATAVVAPSLVAVAIARGDALLAAAGGCAFAAGFALAARRDAALRPLRRSGNAGAVSRTGLAAADRTSDRAASGAA